MTTGTDAPETGDQAPETEHTDQTPAPTEVDWKSKAREWEKRAKANADAATRLAEFEESQKSEAQKLSDAKTAAEQDAALARAEALRWRIAAKHGISDEDAELFLTGTDEETLTKQAERLAERVTAPAGDGRPRPPKPDPNQGKPVTDGASTGDQFAAFFTSQLGK